MFFDAPTLTNQFNKNHHPEQEKMSYDKSVPQPRRGGYQRVAQDEQDDSSTQSSDVNMTDRRRRNQKRLGREAKKKCYSH